MIRYDHLWKTWEVWPFFRYTYRKGNRHSLFLIRANWESGKGFAPSQLWCFVSGQWSRINWTGA